MGSKGSVFSCTVYVVYKAFLSLNTLHTQQRFYGYLLEDSKWSNYEPTHAGHVVTALI